jgi:uncharacterized cupin superfamily protein
MSMPKIDIPNVKVESGSNYPEPFRQVTIGRHRKRLGNAVGLDQIGVNLTTLRPGSASSQRHWHENEDELVYMLEGEVVLVEDDGETVLKPGDAAGWKAGARNGHCLINRTDRDAIFLEIGTRAKRERAHYSDIDMRVERDEKGQRYFRKNGEPYK